MQPSNDHFERSRGRSYWRFAKAVSLTAVLSAFVPIVATYGQADEKFIPVDVGRASAVGCSIQGFGDGSKFAQSQVFVKMKHDEPGWDFRPIMSRRDTAEKAIDDCVGWFQEVKKKIVEAKKACCSSNICVEQNHHGGTK